ncbi:D-glycerate dehydrogenase [Planococcus sp. ISL-109]|uniref:2-hydroxyacid dehydrogenase n=1 Tax=Planococcus sp. ISL-109 TaxID=2819166 RepID=UPI001BE6B8B4|nr:D-glycerate dehydrogenase [Planococcus sp. ISL-109]MBT2583497.1 D-glycerate dehydrogenase [Planococcus sp. ISL-109]
MKPILFITQKLPDQAVADLQEVYEVRMWPEEEQTAPREKLLEEAKQAQALWTMLGDQIDRELLEAAPNLKIVVNLAVGYDNIDLDTAREHKVIATNTPDVLTETTADLTFTLMLATARRLIEAERTVRNGEWQAWTPMGMTGQNVHGTTLGIIGMGRIGEAVCMRAQGFDMEVIYHNRTRKSLEEAQYAELDDLLRRSDFVVVLAPLTEQTRGMVGERELSLMKDSAILINCGRGGIVDEQALYEALKNKVIWGAGLDVFEEEPLPLDHPLQKLDNLTVTPHIGSATVQTRFAMMELNKEALKASANGKPVKNRVC